MMISERFPRRLIFITRCGCTKTLYEGAGRRGVDREHRLPLENTTTTQFVNGDFPADLIEQLHTYYRCFILSEIRFDEGRLCHELVYREKDHRG